MHVPMWEWRVSGGACDNTSGLSSTRHGAIDALCHTLIEGKSYATGYVKRVLLVDGISGPHYVRGSVLHAAVYDSGVIRWSGADHGTDNGGGYGQGPA